jgi:hypothetical protein
LALRCAASTVQSTAFTYQGSLTANNGPANGNFDLTFKLFDSVTGPNQIGPTRTMLQFPVVNGVFTTDLDFGGPFNGAQLWLEVTVGAEILSPRQPVNAVPVAQFALSGVTGAPGNNGFNSLVAQAVEPPGAHCTAGGTRITSGIDANANNTLDANEVTATSYICNFATTPAPPAGCSTQPLGWEPAAVTYNYVDPQPGSWPGVNAGDTVTLTPHALDPNSCSGGIPVSPLSYSWALISAPAGSKAIVFPANSASPSFVPDVPGTYQIAVTAVDAIGLSSPVAMAFISTTTCGVNPVNAQINSSAIAAPSNPYGLSSVVSTSDNDSNLCPARFGTSFTYTWSVINAPLSATWSLSSPTLPVTQFQSTNYLSGLYTVQAAVHDTNGQTGYALWSHTYLWVNLTLAIAGNGSGTVTPSPLGASCGTNCYIYDSGTAVQITASPSAGSSFTTFSGGGCSTTNPCSTNVDASATVTAFFSSP